VTADIHRETNLRGRLDQATYLMLLNLRPPCVECVPDTPVNVTRELIPALQAGTGQTVIAEPKLVNAACSISKVSSVVETCALSRTVPKRVVAVMPWLNRDAVSIVS